MFLEHLFPCLQRDGADRWVDEARQRAAAVLLACVVAIASRASEAQAGGSTALATDFIDSIGINTHLIWDDSSYNDFDLVAASLDYLGIQHVRDAIFNNQTLLDRIDMLGERGIKFNFFINGEAGAPVNGLEWQIAEMARRADLVASIEGPNETENWPVTWHDLSGFEATRAIMHELKEEVRSTPELSDRPIVQTSFGRWESYRTFGDLSGPVNIANAHTYFSYGEAPGAGLAERLAEALLVTDVERLISSEAGYHTATGIDRGWVGLTEEVHAKYTTRLLLEQYRQSVERTYLYELFDLDTNGPLDNPELHFGLFESDGRPKLAATAIHNLVTLLRDGTGEAIELVPFDYDVEGPPTVHSLMLQRSRGAYSLVLWNEVSGWDYKAAEPQAVTPVEVNVEFGGAIVDGKVFDVLDPGQDLTLSFDDLAAMSVMVPDQPLVIQLTTASTVGDLQRPGAQPELAVTPSSASDVVEPNR